MCNRKEKAPEGTAIPEPGANENNQDNITTSEPKSQIRTEQEIREEVKRINLMIEKYAGSDVNSRLVARKWALKWVLMEEI